jgi:pimeloyl-ACP methyl ester carboxylesterase
MLLNKKAWRWLLTSIVIFSLFLLMDSCLQFRMSKSEIDAYFIDKETKGILKQYDLDKRRVTYLVAGDSTKPLVVFVHGSPGSLSAFIDFMADTALLKRAQLITVDRPGFGASNFGYAEPSLIKQVSLLEPILRERKNNRPIILVGHSLGGPFIARMAMDYPELVDGLVMVAPSIDPALEPYEWFRAPMATPFIKWLLPRSIRASNDEIYKLKPQLEAMLPLWKNIKATTIVIQGTKDSLVDPKNADFAKKMIVAAPVSLVMIEGMDHFIPWSAPEKIRESVIELLDEYNDKY